LDPHILDLGFRILPILDLGFRILDLKGIEQSEIRTQWLRYHSIADFGFSSFLGSYSSSTPYRMMLRKCTFFEYEDEDDLSETDLLTQYT
jgi:hypothetical protein